MHIVLNLQKNLRNKIKQLPLETEPLSVQELKNSTTILRKTQEEGFHHDLIHLATHGTVHRKSKLSSLNPFLDEQGMICVGGRLRNAHITNDHKHPILLSKDHAITKLVIQDMHIKHCHAGVQNTVAAIKTLYWPINANNLVKQAIRQCITCFKANPKPAQHIMGDLPKHRNTKPTLYKLRN